MNKKKEKMQLSPIYTKIQWGITLFVLIIDIAWVGFSSLELHYNIDNFFIFIFLLLVLYLPYTFYKKYRPDPKIMTALLTTFFFLSFSFFIFVLSYLSYTIDLPLFDETLARWDSHFGFHAPDIVHWFRAHRWLYLVFGEIYNAYYFQLPFVIFYFSFFVKTNDLQRFMVLYMISALLTIFVNSFFPAVATYGWYQYPPESYEISTLNRVFELRNNVLNLLKGDGIITFPSFHTVVGLIYIYIFHNQRRVIFIPILFLNFLMIFSCLSHGGHYLVDLFGGAAVFLITIAIEHGIFVTVRKYESLTEEVIAEKPLRRSIRPSSAVD